MAKNALFWLAKTVLVLCELHVRNDYNLQESFGMPGPAWVGMVLHGCMR